MGLFTERDEETPNEIIIGKLNRIEAKLDAVIKALHDYDEGTLHCEYSGLPSVEAYSNEAYGESSFEAFIDNEEELNKRMDIIGQNGNEGSHYVTNEEADEDAKFNDYGMRMMDRDRDKDNNKGTQPKQKQYYKNKRSKRSENKK
jgi:hypothetical protein